MAAATARLKFGTSRLESLTWTYLATLMRFMQWTGVLMAKEWPVAVKTNVSEYGEDSHTSVPFLIWQKISHLLLTRSLPAGARVARL